MTTFLN